MQLDEQFLKGSFTPVITPFRDGDVDLDSYARLVEFQISEGSHGILVNGTTAEPSTLTVSERNSIVDMAISVSNGRVPVVVANGSQSHEESILLTAHAEKAGADALLLVTPTMSGRLNVALWSTTLIWGQEQACP